MSQFGLFTADQVLKSELKKKREILNKYIEQLRGFNNQARDKQSEIDRLQAEVAELNRAIQVLNT